MAFQFLGLLPAKNEFRWVLLEGSAEDGFVVPAHKKVAVPEFGTREQELSWVYTNVLESVGKMAIDFACVVQGALNATNNTDAVLHRAQVEGVILAALGAIKADVCLIKKAGIVTKFGLKRGSSVGDIPQLQAIRGDNGMPKHFDEALAAALFVTRQGSLVSTP
ncbi:hypothetical protein [Arthrobacter sp. Alg241-R88]|uniref:hypothetical protein n=1 Tax=Arthrobacter sp. Alg241-R88 TaxID=2305984 RepID=UPI0013D39D19|nr:hypothetical protein [Arthrobacter sp. Alg241-R88]